MPPSRLLVIGLLSCLPMGAVVVNQAPGKFIFDGAIEEWKGWPSAFGSPGDSSIWLAQSRNGLVLAGFVTGSSRFAKTPAELGRGGAIEISIQLVDGIRLPDLPYEEGDCTQAADDRVKNACTAWFEHERIYRDSLERQFARVWRVTPAGAMEDYATRAYGLFTSEERERLHFLEPSGMPSFRFRETNTKTTFEILVPWSILPPADVLSVAHLRVNAAFESFAPAPSTRVLSNLQLATLFTPVTSRITTCNQPMLAKDDDKNKLQTFYFLTKSLQVNHIFYFEDPPVFWREPTPRKEEISPMAAGRSFWVQEIGPGEFLCGPYMSYRRGSTLRNYPFELMDVNDIIVKQLANGDRLLIDGPVSSEVPGSIRSVSFINYVIFYLGKDLSVNEALHLSGRWDGTAGYELEIAPNLARVTEFQQTEAGDWSSETFCLSGRTYRSCAKNPKSPPPAKRVLTQDAQ